MILSGRYRPALMFLIALVLALIFVPQTQATLLVYESFDYTAGNNVKGQNGGLGFSGTWNYSYTAHDGMVLNLTDTPGRTEMAPPALALSNADR